MPISTQTSTNTTAPAILKLRASTEAEPNHIRQLREQGYAVVKNVLPQSTAQGYVARANEWLQSFERGFDPKDKSTWWVVVAVRHDVHSPIALTSLFAQPRHVKNLPPHHRGGLYNDLGVGQEDLLWSIRTEPALVDVFAELWGTSDLLVSFGELK